jgi:hypothetical protein
MNDQPDGSNDQPDGNDPKSSFWYIPPVWGISGWVALPVAMVSIVTAKRACELMLPALGRWSRIIGVILGFSLARLVCAAIVWLQGNRRD